MVTLDKGKVGGGEAAAFDVQERPNGAAKNEGAAPAETDEAVSANGMSARGWDGNVKAAAAPAELCVEKPAETDEAAAHREQIAVSEVSFTQRQARDQETFGNDSDGITKISQVPAEEVLFFRGLGFSNYYIIKIYDLVGEAAIALTQDNAFWLLEEFPRLGFAQAFMEDPDVLILAEPFNAMDKASMEEVHDLLQHFKAQNKTVLLASHSAEDIARACDVIYEMEDGGLHLVKQ